MAGNARPATLQEFDYLEHAPLPVMKSFHFLAALFVAGLAAVDVANSPAPLPARQVHLECRTAADMPGVGARFNKQRWQEALRVGHVNWINVFARS